LVVIPSEPFLLFGPGRQLLAQVSLTSEAFNVPTAPDVFNVFHGSFAARPLNNSIDKIGCVQPWERSAEDFTKNKKPRRVGAVSDVSLLQQR
jgi:hypothetical protein